MLTVYTLTVPVLFQHSCTGYCTGTALTKTTMEVIPTNEKKNEATVGALLHNEKLAALLDPHDVTNANNTILGSFTSNQVLACRQSVRHMLMALKNDIGQTKEGACSIDMSAHLAVDTKMLHNLTQKVVGKSPNDMKTLAEEMVGCFKHPIARHIAQGKMAFMKE